MSEREQLLELMAETAEAFREQVIRRMLADGFPERESARLCDVLVAKRHLDRGDHVLYEQALARVE